MVPNQFMRSFTLLTTLMFVFNSELPDNLDDEPIHPIHPIHSGTDQPLKR